MTQTCNIGTSVTPAFRFAPALPGWGCHVVLSLVTIAYSVVHADEAPKPAPVVNVLVATNGPIREFEFAEGTAHALRREFLLFEASGKINFVRSGDTGTALREGDAVTAGSVLATLENNAETASVSSAQASLDAARAGLASAQSSFDRAENLKAGGAISERDYERAVTSLEQSRARVQTAETALVRSSENVQGSQLIAPFDGVVAFINIREGQYISPTSYRSSTEASAIRTAPIVLIDPSAFEIVVNVPSFVGAKLSIGQTAFILRQETLADLQSVGTDTEMRLERELLSGDVVSVSPAINPDDRSIRTRVRVQDTLSDLRDGEHVTVWLQTGRKPDALVVPTSAILKRNGQSFVVKLDAEDRAFYERVSLGLIGLNGIEVLSGIAAGDRIVTKGKNRVRAGETVRIAAQDFSDQTIQ